MQHLNRVLALKAKSKVAITTIAVITFKLLTSTIMSAQGLRNIIKYLIVLLLIKVSKQIEFANSSGLIKVEARNSTGVEIHFVLDLLKAHGVSPYENISRISTARNIQIEEDLEKVLSEVLNGQWNNKHLLLELAELTKDLNAKIKIFTVLWRTLQSSKKIYNPFELITLYQQLEVKLPTTATATISPAFVYTKTQLSQVKEIKLQLRNALTTRSSQILEAAAYIRTYSLQNTTLNLVLQRLDELQDTTVFVETLDKIYIGVEELVTLEQLADVVNNFSINLKQKVIANLQLLQHLRDTNSSRTIQVKTKLIQNLKALVNERDFGKLTPDWRIRVNSYLPQSMRNLYSGTSKLCIRNVTNPNKYLYECPQTYLMCTNGKQLQQAAFLVDRNDAGLFGFRSIYWANRYIRLEGGNSNTTTGNGSAAPAFTKNIYSKHGASYWHIRFDGDYATFIDPTSRFYLCGGNSEAWSADEQHVYTRIAASYVEYQNECQWVIEDCGTIATWY